MKKRFFALLLIFTLLSSRSAMAYSRSDFAEGAPSGITFDGDALLVTDTDNHLVWRVEGDTVGFFAGRFISRGDYFDDTYAEAEFGEPWDIVPFLDGFAVSDSSANVIRYLAGGEVMTAVGTEDAGFTDGKGTKALLNQPTGLAVDDSGNVYIADTGNDAIRVMDTQGNVTTLITDVKEPTGLCWADGKLYVCETGKNRICRIEDGRLAVIAGNSKAEDGGFGEYAGGYVDGPVANAWFDHPQGIAVSRDIIYVADTNNHAVRKIENGRVSTVIVSRNSPDGPVKPRGILMKDETLYVTDAFLGTLLVIEPEYKEYIDVKEDAWYADPVRTATERGLVKGVGEDKFDPASSVTRAMFVSMLSNMHLNADGNAVIDGDTVFADLTEETWYSGAARWAGDNGVVAGIGGNFKGSQSITREQLVTMLWNYAKSFGYDVAAGEDTNILSYEDIDELSSYAVSPMQWACGSGIVKGFTDGTLQPKGSVTRAQAAVILVQFMDIYGL